MKSQRKKILRDLDAAREGLFPHRTCPASRHVHLIVEGLLDRKSPLARDLSGYEPEHMAGSIASVLEGLWKARRWMRWQPNVEGEPLKGGDWVPDLKAIAASGIPTEGGDAKQAPGDSLSSPTLEEGDAQHE